MLFLTSYRGRSTETGSLTLRILCKSAKIKFQIGIVSFSLRLSCQILVHRLGWKESRLGGDKLIKVKLAMALQASAGGFGFGLFSSLFLTSSAFHRFKGES